MSTTNTNTDAISQKQSTSYFGGKSGSGTYQTIINQIPAHTCRVSLFGGMLGVERKLKPAKLEYVIELDTNTFQRYPDMGYFQNVHATSYESVADQQKWMQGAMWGKGKFCWNADSLKVLPILAHSELWDQEGTFIYVDPPYPMDSRKDPRNRYRHELTDDQHRELLALLTHFQNANIAVSTYPNEIYQDWFWDNQHHREWRMIEFQSQTRKGPATEQLWMNYPEPTQLHDYRYLGEDYRERERITRQKKRLLGKIKKLSLLEQQNLIEGIQSLVNHNIQRIDR